jgi:hypothetical protein
MPFYFLTLLDQNRMINSRHIVGPILQYKKNKNDLKTGNHPETKADIK